MNGIFEELVADIAEWNATTFPDATEAGQLHKLDEEFHEWTDSGEMIEELADCFIVAAALAERWGNPLGTFLLPAILKRAGNNIDDLYTAIVEKMEINRARVWNKLPDGRFKHEGE